MPWITIISAVVALLVGIVIGWLLPGRGQQTAEDPAEQSDALAQLKRNMTVELNNQETLLAQAEAVYNQLHEQTTTLYQLIENNGQPVSGPAAPKDYASTRHGIIKEEKPEQE